jgi:hypothetical protein
MLAVPKVTILVPALEVAISFFKSLETFGGPFTLTFKLGGADELELHSVSTTTLSSHKGWSHVLLLHFASKGFDLVDQGLNCLISRSLCLNQLIYCLCKFLNSLVLSLDLCHERCNAVVMVQCLSGFSAKAPIAFELDLKAVLHEVLSDSITAF